MGSNASFSLQKEDIHSIAEETGFNPNQIKRLYNRFHFLDQDNTGHLERDDFLRIPELHVNPLRDRIIEVLIVDFGQNGKINFAQFAKCMSTFKRGKAGPNNLNSKENKLKFLYSIYDRDKDTKIDKKELLGILRMLVGSNIPEEQMSSIADRTIAELDFNGDYNITFREFCDTLKKIDIDEKMSMKFLN